MVATLGLAVLAVLAADKGAWKPSFDAEKKAVAYLKENVNDLSKFMLVKIGRPFNPHGWRIDEERLYSVVDFDGAAVYVKYRASNVFGAVAIEEDVIFFKPDGAFARKCEASRIHPPGKDVPTEERFSDSFLDRYRH